MRPQGPDERFKAAVNAGAVVDLTGEDSDDNAPIHPAVKSEAK